MDPTSLAKNSYVERVAPAAPASMIGRARSGLIVAGIAFALGVLTAYAQQWLPAEVGSLANSAGSWTVASFALALLARDRAGAAAFGCLALLVLLAGYVFGAELRNTPSSSAMILFWGLAAVVAGPFVGLAAFWLKTDRGLPAALGTAAISGVLIGEGTYGLTQIADTTYPPYWWAEIALGAALLGWVSLRRMSLQAAAVAVALSAVVAVAFITIYTANLITLLA